MTPLESVCAWSHVQGMIHSHGEWGPKLRSVAWRVLDEDEEQHQGSFQETEPYLICHKYVSALSILWPNVYH